MRLRWAQRSGLLLGVRTYLFGIEVRYPECSTDCGSCNACRQTNKHADSVCTMQEEALPVELDTERQSPPLLSSLERERLTSKCLLDTVVSLNSMQSFWWLVEEGSSCWVFLPPTQPKCVTCRKMMSCYAVSCHWIVTLHCSLGDVESLTSKQDKSE